MRFTVRLTALAAAALLTLAMPELPRPMKVSWATLFAT